MIWWRPPRQRTRKHWYDTQLCRDLTLTGLMAGLWVRHFFPTLGLVEANDNQDHVRW